LNVDLLYKCTKVNATVNVHYYSKCMHYTQ
jgi:hypothetical protein